SIHIYNLRNQKLLQQVNCACGNVSRCRINKDFIAFTKHHSSTITVLKNDDNMEEISTKAIGSALEDIDHTSFELGDNRIFLFNNKFLAIYVYNAGACQFESSKYFEFDTRLISITFSPEKCLLLALNDQNQILTVDPNQELAEKIDSDSVIQPAVVSKKIEYDQIKSKNDQTDKNVIADFKKHIREELNEREMMRNMNSQKAIDLLISELCSMSPTALSDPLKLTRLFVSRFSNANQADC
ncbi:MAG: hypothetical protein MHMPM18_002756, partial [Marteilia pararefringens]